MQRPDPARNRAATGSAARASVVQDNLEFDHRGATARGRQHIECAAASATVRLRIDPDRVEQNLTPLVFTLVAFPRRLMKVQSVRRREPDRIAAEKAERLGLTLLRSKPAVRSLRGPSASICGLNLYRRLL